MQWLNKSTLIISVVFIILFAGLGVISFSDLDIPYLNWLEKGIFNLISPVIEGITGFYNSFNEYWVAVMHTPQLIDQNKQLQQRVTMLEMDRLLNQYYKNENERLQKLLNFKEHVSLKVLGARVIGYSTTQWENRLVIDRGSKDGVEPRMPVISYNGNLVGRVDYVGVGSSQILLINNPDYVVGGIVQRPDSRAIGLIKGQANDNNYNIMDNISWNTASQEGDIKVGDVIVTSGLSNLYPKGLPIGEVISVDKDNYGLSQKATIDLYFNNKTLEEVLVITEF